MPKKVRGEGKAGVYSWGLGGGVWYAEGLER